MAGYQQFSFAEKEKLRQKYTKKDDQHDKAVNTVISKLKKALSGAG